MPQAPYSPDAPDTMTTPSGRPEPAASPLGRASAFPDRYDPGLLFPIDRAPAREALGLTRSEPLPFVGEDLWSAYELSWLNLRGRPEVAIAHLRVPCTSPRIVESKSFKLYLNSFNAERLPDAEAVRARVSADVAATVGAPVELTLLSPAAWRESERLCAPQGESLDGLDVDCTHRAPAPELLQAEGPEVEEHLHSELLKSNCPVTGQPDWAMLTIAYRGPALDRAGLLRYIASFRDHGGFHEDCVERIFLDLLQRARPHWLQVMARYTRRGGLDINPWRATPGAPVAGRPGFERGARQ